MADDSCNLQHQHCHDQNEKKNSIDQAAVENMDGNPNVKGVEKKKKRKVSIEGNAILCFVNENWFQGHLLVFDSDGISPFRTFGILGEKNPISANATYHECCYPEGPPEMYRIKCVEYNAGLKHYECQFPQVEKSGGDLVCFLADDFEFRTNVCKTNNAAFAILPKYFPNIKPTEDIIICMGQMKFSVDEDSESAEDSSAPSNHDIVTWRTMDDFEQEMQQDLLSSRR